MLRLCALCLQNVGCRIGCRFSVPVPPWLGLHCSPQSGLPRLHRCLVSTQAAGQIPAQLLQLCCCLLKPGLLLHLLNPGTVQDPPEQQCLHQRGQENQMTAVQQLWCGLELGPEQQLRHAAQNRMCDCQASI